MQGRLGSGSHSHTVTCYHLRALSVSWLVMRSMYLIMTFTAERTTAELACWRRGVTRSMIDSACEPGSMQVILKALTHL